MSAPDPLADIGNRRKEQSLLEKTLPQRLRTASVYGYYRTVTSIAPSSEQIAFSGRTPGAALEMGEFSPNRQTLLRVFSPAM